MKLHPIIQLSIFFVLLCLVSCTSAPPAETAAAPTQPPATQVESTSTVSSPVNTDTPSPVPTAAGPEVKVGATYYYVDGTTLVAVPAGDFTMGGKGTDNPEHSVNLNDYWVYSTKVTNQQYALCESLGKCTAPSLKNNPKYKDYSSANNPVTGVTYDQAAAYCSFVQGRLPTEAEWEKAARNPDGSPYPWGKTTPSCDLLNFNNCSGHKSSVVKYPNGASYYGSLDMAGNAFEWVADWYAADYYGTSPKDNPQGPASGTARSVRSSSYASNPSQIDVAVRSSEDPQKERPDLGFRCVVDKVNNVAPFCEAPVLYSQSAGEAASSVCPPLQLEQAPTCLKKLAVTNVTASGASDIKIISSCDPTNDPNTVACQQSNPVVSAQAGCQVNVSGDSSCERGYSLQGNTCFADGGQGICPAGLNFDASKQCCALPSGTAATNAAVCPVGTYYLSSKNACMPTPVQELVTVVVSVQFRPCTGGGSGASSGSGSSACQKPDVGCPNEYDWSTANCCCQDSTGHCYPYPWP